MIQVDSVMKRSVNQRIHKQFHELPIVHTGKGVVTNTAGAVDAKQKINHTGTRRRSWYRSCCSCSNSNRDVVQTPLSDVQIDPLQWNHRIGGRVIQIAVKLSSRILREIKETSAVRIGQAARHALTWRRDTRLRISL